MVWSAIFAGILGFIFAEPLISVIFGPGYSKAADVLKIMAWLLPLFILSGHYRSMLFGLGQQRLDFVSTAFGAVMSAILCFFVIAKFGATGAAGSMLVAEIVTLAFAYYFVRAKILWIPILRHLIKPVIASLIMLAVLHFSPLYGIWANGGLAVLLFFVTMQILQPTLLSDIRSLALVIK